MSTSDQNQDYDVLIKNVRKALEYGNKTGALPDAEDIARIIFDLAIGKRTAFRTTFGKEARMILLLRKILPIKVFLNLITKHFSKANP